MSSQYKRGQRAFGAQPGRRDNDFWDKNVVKLEEPAMNKVLQIRPVGGILTIGVHYVTFISPKDGQIKGFPIQCPNWNIAEAMDDDNGCPICRDFHWNLPIEQKKYEFLKMPQKYRYLFHAFHVSNIVANRTPTFGCIETHALGLGDIEEAMMVKGAQPDDPTHGYCLNWLCKKPKSAQFKKDIKFSAGDALKVKDLGKGAWGIVVEGTKVKGVEQDLLSVIPAPPTADVLTKKLTDLGLYALLDRVVGRGSRSVTSTPADLDDLDDADTDDADTDDAGTDWDADDTEDDAKEADTESNNPDADDWDEEEEAEDEAVAEEEEAEDWDADPEPEPAKKTKKKAAKKPAAKKKVAKKAAAKPAPEPEPDDDDDDDDDLGEDWD